MLELDEEDYALLGFGQERAYERILHVGIQRLKVRSALTMLWAKENPKKKAAIDKKYEQSARGKQVRAKKWARYYAKNKKRLIEQNKMRRLDPAYRLKERQYAKNYHAKRRQR